MPSSPPGDAAGSPAGSTGAGDCARCGKPSTSSEGLGGARPSRRHQRARFGAGRRPRRQVVRPGAFRRMVQEWSCSAAPIHDPPRPVGCWASSTSLAATYRHPVRPWRGPVGSRRRRTPSCAPRRRPHPGAARSPRLTTLDSGAAVARRRRGRRAPLSPRHARSSSLLQAYPEGLTEQLAMMLADDEAGCGDRARRDLAVAPDARRRRRVTAYHRLTVDVSDVDEVRRRIEGARSSPRSGSWGAAACSPNRVRRASSCSTNSSSTSVHAWSPAVMRAALDAWCRPPLGRRPHGVGPTRRRPPRARQSRPGHGDARVSWIGPGTTARSRDPSPPTSRWPSTTSATSPAPCAPGRLDLRDRRNTVAYHFHGAARRRRADHPVELPDPDGRLEARARRSPPRATASC